jgi:hypothetical protein
MKRLWLVIVLCLGLSAYSLYKSQTDYITLSKTWSDAEILTHTDLNQNFDDVNNGIDSLALAIQDTVSRILNDSLFAKRSDAALYIPQLIGVDDTDPPVSLAIHGRDASSFANDSTQIVYVNCPLDNFSDFSTDKGLYLTYSMSTSNTGTFVTKIDYTVHKIDGVMSSVTTRSDTVTTDPSNSIDIMEITAAHTITASDIDAATNRVEIILRRLHDHASDTHTGNLFVYDYVLR